MAILPEKLRIALLFNIKSVIATFKSDNGKDFMLKQFLGLPVTNFEMEPF
jgi:hypothetical protein